MRTLKNMILKSSTTNSKHSRRTSILIAFMLICTVLSCGETKAQDNMGRYIYHNEVQFEKVKSYSLAIDTMMMPKVSYLCYDEGAHQLSLLNPDNNQIYNYQLGTQEEVKPQSITAIGFPGRTLGFMVLSNDSILCFDDNASSLRLFSLPGWTKQWSVAPFEAIEEAAGAHLEAGNDISTFDSLFFGVPYVDYAHPMVKVGSSVYISLLGSDPSEMGVPLDGRFVPSVVSIDLISKAIDYSIPFSPVYDEVNWGGGFFFRHTSIAPYKEGKLLVSYPADNNLYLWDIADKKLSGTYAGAYDIDRIMPKDSTEEYISMDDGAWGSTQPRYATVLYDKYRDLIYRIATLPVEKDPKTKTEYRPMVVVVLDGDMNYIGEWTIPHPEEYGFSSFFVSSEGLNIERKNSRDNHHIYFDTYAPVF